MFPECQLFTSIGCHLCEQAEEILLPMTHYGLVIKVTEITEDPINIEKYGLRIPVLCRTDTGDELSWPFDSEQAAAFLE